MGVYTFSLNDETAKKFKNETPKQETSAVLEQLMKDYLDEQPEKEIILDLKKLNLSDSQQQLLDMLIEEKISKKNTNNLFSACRKKNIYGRSHHFGEGLSSIVNNEEIPYKLENDVIISKDVDCSCGSSQAFVALVKNDFSCFNCGKKIVRY